jgi:hypothetical protein
MFFKRLYREARILFFVILLAVLGQAFFMWKGVEHVPFFLYHMFGFAHERKAAYPVLVVRYGGTDVSPYSLSNREAELIFNTVDRYLRLREQGDYLAPLVEQRFRHRWLQTWQPIAQQRLLNDSLDMAAFPAWWAARLRVYVPQAQQQEITVWRGLARYHPAYQLQMESSPQLRIPAQQP